MRYGLVRVLDSKVDSTPAAETALASMADTTHHAPATSDPVATKWFTRVEWRDDDNTANSSCLVTVDHIKVTEYLSPFG